MLLHQWACTNGTSASKSSGCPAQTQQSFYGCCKQIVKDISGCCKGGCESSRAGHLRLNGHPRQNMPLLIAQVVPLRFYVLTRLALSDWSTKHAPSAAAAHIASHGPQAVSERGREQGQPTCVSVNFRASAKKHSFTYRGYQARGQSTNHLQALADAAAAAATAAQHCDLALAAAKAELHIPSPLVLHSLTTHCESASYELFYIRYTLKPCWVEWFAAHAVSSPGNNCRRRCLGPWAQT